MNFDWNEQYKLRKSIPLQPFTEVVTAVSQLDKFVGQHGKTVLDVGCGAGNHYSWLTSIGYKYLGIDSSQAAIQLARRLHPNAASENFQIDDFLKFEAPKNSFNLVIDRHATDQLSAKQEQITMLHKIRNLLVDGGYYVGVFFYGQDNFHLPRNVGSQFSLTDIDLKILMTGFTIQQLTRIERTDLTIKKQLTDEIVVSAVVRKSL